MVWYASEATVEKKSAPERKASRSPMSPDRWVASRISIWSASMVISTLPSRGTNASRTVGSLRGRVWSAGFCTLIRAVRVPTGQIVGCTRDASSTSVRKCLKYGPTNFSPRRSSSSALASWPAEPPIATNSSSWSLSSCLRPDLVRPVIASGPSSSSNRAMHWAREVALTMPCASEIQARICRENSPIWAILAEQ